VQPDFILPFEPGDVWALTGGPHTGWGNGAPLAALDFAPPSKISGCVRSGVWATAVADGVVVRSTIGEVMLDLDGDGDERTGWTIFYMHVASEGRALLGTSLKQGDRIGHPSCEGGTSTGTHIHIDRHGFAAGLGALAMVEGAGPPLDLTDGLRCAIVFRPGTGIPDIVGV